MSLSKLHISSMLYFGGGALSTEGIMSEELNKAKVHEEWRTEENSCQVCVSTPTSPRLHMPASCQLQICNKRAALPAPSKYGRMQAWPMPLIGAGPIQNFAPEAADETAKEGTKAS
nr:hypothetical protein Iba_chr02bCG21490 [Ipomoea batatas]GMD86201.1 hypothetical protein Iba_chr14bCG3810 [Ipomoea batatas]